MGGEISPFSSFINIISYLNRVKEYIVAPGSDNINFHTGIIYEVES